MCLFVRSFTVSVVCIATIISICSSAQAMPTTFGLSLVGAAGDRFDGETVSGTIEFDTDLTPAVGSVDLDSSDFELTVSRGGQTFTNSNDINFPQFPGLTVTDQVPVFLDFLLVQDVNSVDFGIPGLLTFTAFTDLVLDSPLTSEVSGTFDTLSVTPVPEPGTVLLYALGATGTAMARRVSKRRKAATV